MRHLARSGAAIDLFSLGSHQQLPRAVLNSDHSFGSIAERVESHLLELDTIADDGREVLGEFGPQNHPISLKIAQRQCNHLCPNLVQIEDLQCEFLLAEQGPQSRNHIGGEFGVGNASLTPGCDTRL